MITDVEFINIKSHKHSTFSPSEGVTVIKGSSHAGKSNLRQGLEAALLNSPRISSLVSWFADNEESSVGINFKEDTFIVRRKDGKFNGYDSPNGPLEAISTDLPKEITDITQMSSINIQSQHDGYFMLAKSVSPGQVAKELNEIVGLDIIDESFKKCEQIIRKAEADNTHCEEDIETKKIELEAYKNLAKVENMVNELVQLLAEFDRIFTENEMLIILINDIKECKEGIDSLNEWLLVVPKYKELSKMLVEYEALQKQTEDLQILITDIQTEEQTIKDLNDWLAVKIEYDSIQNMLSELATIENKTFILQKLCSDIRFEQQTLKKRQNLLLVNQKAYDLFLKRNKYICPLCGGKMKECKHE